MSKRRRITVPKYEHHKASNTARVSIAGRYKSLGRYDSPSSHAKYDRLIAEWMASGCPSQHAEFDITVEAMSIAFWEHSVKAIRPPELNDPLTMGDELDAFNRLFKQRMRGLDRIRQTTRLLCDLYGDVKLEEFGPISLKAVRSFMVDSGAICRKEINARINTIRSMFKWAASEEMIDESIHRALQTVSGLRVGAIGAFDHAPVEAVASEQVNAIRPFVSRQVWAIVQMQIFTAARAGEILIMRPGDIDRSEDIWVYTPQNHKTAHHNIRRFIYIGEQAQRVLTPFLFRDDDRYCFSPAEAQKEFQAARAAARKTPLSYGNRPGTNRKRKPKRATMDRYESTSYPNAIYRACDRAFPPPAPLAKRTGGDERETTAEWNARLNDVQKAELKAWQKDHRWHPHQLRHYAATHIRAEFDRDTAQAILGHQNGATTEIYAPPDHSKAFAAMREIG